LAVARNSFKTIVVTGVPGVGKTTVLKKFEEMAKERGAKLLVVNFGDYMLKAALSEGLVKSRDEIRKLPQRKQLELQLLAAKKIVEEARKVLEGGGVLVVDTHAVVKTPSGYWTGLPEHVVKELNPDSIVVVEAKPEEILERQMADATRKREDVGASLEKLVELMEVARMAAISSATLTASSVFIVENPPGRPEEAAEKLLELVQSI